MRPPWPKTLSSQDSRTVRRSISANDKPPNIPEFRIDPDKVNQFAKDISKIKADRFVAIAGGPRGEHKLGMKQASVKLDLTMEDGRAITLMVGANYLNQGYYAATSLWPDAVFMLSGATVEPLLRGASVFAKERLGAN